MEPSSGEAKSTDKTKDTAESSSDSEIDESEIFGKTKEKCLFRNCF